jgi:hypothetical protein
MQRDILRSGVDLLASSVAVEEGKPGPPASFDVLFTWFTVSVAAYVCFIRLPGKLQPQFNLVTRAHTSFNDFAWAAHNLHLCTLLWFLYDVLHRVLCLLLLPRSVLLRLQFPLHSDASEAMTTGERESVVLLPEACLILIDSLRDITVGDSLRFVSPDDPSPFRRMVTYHVVVVGTSSVCLVAVCFMTWQRHSKRYLRGELIEQRLEMKDPKTGDPMKIPRQYAIKVTLLPRSFWMLLWTLAFLSAFAWMRALPVLTKLLFPAVVCLLLVLEVLMP